MLHPKGPRYNLLSPRSGLRVGHPAFLRMAAEKRVAGSGMLVRVWAGTGHPGTCLQRTFRASSAAHQRLEGPGGRLCAGRPERLSFMVIGVPQCTDHWPVLGPTVQDQVGPDTVGDVPWGLWKPRG